MLWHQQTYFFVMWYLIPYGSLMLFVLHKKIGHNLPLWFWASGAVATNIYCALTRHVFWQIMPWTLVFFVNMAIYWRKGWSNFNIGFLAAMNTLFVSEIYEAPLFVAYALLQNFDVAVNAVQWFFIPRIWIPAFFLVYLQKVKKWGYIVLASSLLWVGWMLWLYLWRGAAFPYTYLIRVPAAVAFMIYPLGIAVRRLSHE